ncbi:MAG: hypothetical protein ACK4NY_03525 [Spirosomataceae bacterium]
MKTKLFLTVFAFATAIYASFACSRSECGGGNDRCCSVGNVIYYTKATAPVKV